MIPYRTLFFVFLAFCIVACSKEKENCNRTPCTNNFVTISVSLKDTSGAYKPLDSYKVVETETLQDFTPNYSVQEFENYTTQGSYPIFSDTYRIQYQNETTTISFIGYVSGKEVVNVEFIVGADCCHVRLISGNTDLILD